MNRYLRGFLYVIAFAQALIAVGMLIETSPAITPDVPVSQLPFFLRFFPFQTGNLTFIFVASIYAAAAASTLWCLVTHEDGALAGIALDYIVILAPMTVGAALLALVGDSALYTFAFACFAGLLFGILLLLKSYRIPITPRPVQPLPVRIAFAVFVVVLILVGGSQALQFNSLMPWPLSPSVGRLVGFMFLGAAAYFAYALVRPSWANSAGQLWGFLAYDLVLLPPFLLRLLNVPEQFRLGHSVYTAVVLASAILAIYYLLIKRETALFRSRGAPERSLDSPAAD